MICSASPDIVSRMLSYSGGCPVTKKNGGPEPAIKSHMVTTDYNPFLILFSAKSRAMIPSGTPLFSASSTIQLMVL